MAGLLFIWTPWTRYDGPRLMPAFRASRLRLVAEPPLGEPQPCDIDINPLAHHSGSRLSYLRLLSLIATAQGHLVDHVADHELIGHPLRHLLALGCRHGAQRRCTEEDAARLLVRARDLQFVGGPAGVNLPAKHQQRRHVVSDVAAGVAV